ncbi:uncharacterized protein CANTADRAFT_58033 [Suhomyces tanzawaensis NRRL Y-17324]|uniref:Protein-lysine N-methyltransferase EFM5 n=1 Tax=Suhomyces tanzawaensis NRRL Y-17324 TaxID=984487 RepID=A0A1E4SB96_9ASCO|nr:uncharacterized protein CANTADRAFT_58033 [Suhomyces tanzawaensis NRRL Y-17324]ODV76672.1 hypothetical protein CANTADRAFT_58033 [Suhomyces tanzawaensis NRRL Y-17324]
MDSDDELTLSTHALAALAEFKKEETERIEKFQELCNSFNGGQEVNQQLTIEDFKQDWKLSQFWYADDTARTLGKALLQGANVDTVIVIASAPSVFAAIKNLPPEEVPTKHIYLFEYDKRFELLAGKEHFYFYDYTRPDDIPLELKHNCHRLLIDPPYLQEDCQTKSAMAAGNLLVEKATDTQQIKLISSTGERMGEIVKKNYPETFVTNFFPEHMNGLSNEYRCYANFECSYWKFQN